MGNCPTVCTGYIQWQPIRTSYCAIIAHINGAVNRVIKCALRGFDGDGVGTRGQVGYRQIIGKRFLTGGILQGSIYVVLTGGGTLSGEAGVSGKRQSGQFFIYCGQTGISIPAGFSPLQESTVGHHGMVGRGEGRVAGNVVVEVRGSKVIFYIKQEYCFHLWIDHRQVGVKFVELI